MNRESNFQQSNPMSSGATERSLQPYVEEVIDEEFLLFGGYNTAPGPGNITLFSCSDRDGFNFEIGGDSGAHSFNFHAMGNSNKRGALIPSDTEQVAPQIRPLDQGTPERRVKMRMDTDRPTNEYSSFAASFASELNRRRKANWNIKNITSERHRMHVLAREQKKQLEWARAMLLAHPVEAGLRVPQGTDFISSSIPMR